MPVTDSLAPRTYPADVYAVGREKVIEYAQAVGETNSLHRDPAAARAAGFADVVAPPMFAVVFQGRALWPAIADPEVGIDFDHLLHGGQAFQFDALIVAGDEITTEVTLTEARERAGLEFFVFETRSHNQRGEPVVTGTWTNLVRPPEVPQ